MIKTPTVLIISIFFTLLIIFLARFLFIGQAIYGDGIFYWSYARSIVIDHDLNLENEAGHPFSPKFNNLPNTIETTRESLVTKRYYAIGTPLSWLPAFTIGHFLSPFFNYPQNGFADSYQVAVGTVNIILICIGLMLLFTLLRTFYVHNIATITILLLVFGTNLFYYGSLDILNSHPTSFFLSCVLLFSLFSKGKTQRKRLLLGMLVGGLALIRPQDALFAIMCIPFLFGQSIKQFLINSTYFTIGFVAVFSIQLITSLLLFNSPFVFPYLTGSNNTFDFLNPHIIELFISTKIGLFYYVPLYSISIIGLILYTKAKKPYALSFLLLFVAELFLISTWSGWEQGESYGLRMFISLLPMLSFGVAEVIQNLKKFFSYQALMAIAIVFIVQNLLMIFLFHLFLHEPTYIGSELSRGSQFRIMLLESIRLRYN